MVRPDLLALLLCAPAASAAILPLPGDVAALSRALESVDPEALRSDLSFLASEEMGGRDTPSPGLERAAAHLEQRLAQLGFQPGAREGYAYRWPRRWRQIDGERSSLVVTRGDARTAWTFGRDYFLVGPRELEDLDAEGAAQSVGSGSSADVAASDLAGRWAVCEWPAGSVLAVARRVEEAGAVGLLVLPGEDDPQERLARSTEALLDGRFEALGRDVFPTPVLSRAAARELCAPSGGKLPAAGSALGLTLAERRRSTHPGGLRLLENVCGLWPGSDPALAGEVIVVSAHYDHVGTMRGVVYNGADDNASGTSGLLAIAEALRHYGPMRRSVLLLWVSGEEKGLWGSEAWTTRPYLPAGHRPVCDINLDMIGRNPPRDLCVTPTRQLAADYNGLVRLAEDCAAEEGFDPLRSADEYWRRSDHMNFADNLGLPVVFLFADVHADYHKPTDDADKIDYDKVRRVTRLVLRMLDGLQGDALELHDRPVPDVESFQAKVRAGWVASDLERLVAACQASARERGGAWPTGADRLDLSDPAVARLLGDALPRDPWGNAYAYDPEQRSWTALGSDGQPGGSGEAADTSLAPER